MLESLISFVSTIGQKEPPSLKIIENIVYPHCMLIEGNVSALVVEDKEKDCISCISTSRDTRCCVKSNKPIYIHPHYTSVYFEITIKSLDPDSVVALGLTTLGFPSFRFMPGWEKNSFGYHSDDGCLFSERGDKALLELATYGAGDTVGMGIENDVLYFVKNGVRFHSVVQLPQSRFYFTVGMRGKSCWTYNFGTSPFVYSSITPKQFKQSLFDSPNIQHPLLSIPQCLWPFFVTPYDKTTERHQTWVALLSTCHAIRDYLFPLFRYLNPFDFCDLVEGYHIKEDRWSDDHFFHIKPYYKYELWIKSEKGLSSSYKGTWNLERVVLDPYTQAVVVKLSSHPSIALDFEFERSDRVITELSVKIPEKEFRRELLTPKAAPFLMMCGADSTPDNSPCCHDAVRDTARKVFSRIPKDQCSHMNEITILLPSIVEQIATACMESAMSTQQIEESVTMAILSIAPEIISFI